MATFEIVMPKLGESIIEATITKWLKKVGDPVNEDDPVLEIATDKVDSEIPSPVSGTLIKQFFAEGDIVEVGKVIALIDLGGEPEEIKPEPKQQERKIHADQPVAEEKKTEPVTVEKQESSRFYSPLIRSIAKQENLSLSELENIPGTGKDQRLTKQDLLQWLAQRKSGPVVTPVTSQPVYSGSGDEIIEMDRIRQLIAQHMVKSVQTSPHVTSIVEIDMTKVVNWRENHKDEFYKREKIKLTFTPVIINAIARAVRDFPQVNVSVDGSKIILHKNINIGMAVSLPNFNLIVPVIKDADQKSIQGLAKTVNDLALRARSGKLIPDEISGGTISLTNLGSFGTLMGTPIINQPQTAIIAVGAIKKRAVVVEDEFGDSIAIRSMMYASISYDHRVIDGALGGQFLNRLTFYLENFDTNQNL